MKFGQLLISRSANEASSVPLLAAFVQAQHQTDRRQHQADQHGDEEGCGAGEAIGREDQHQQRQYIGRRGGLVGGQHDADKGRDVKQQPQQPRADECGDEQVVDRDHHRQRGGHAGETADAVDVVECPGAVGAQFHLADHVAVALPRHAGRQVEGDANERGDQAEADDSP